MEGLLKVKFKAVGLILVFLFLLGIVPAAMATVSDMQDDENQPPMAEDLEFATYRDVAITGLLQAKDAEGDMLEYKLMSEPKKGSVKVMESGEFTYTPAEGNKGKDKFTYVVVDAVGNVSDEATVKINIQRQSTKVTYSDLDGESWGYAAVRLAEDGIFVGEMLGSDYYFVPEQTVTRGEFLAMCLNAGGTQLVENITRTGFSDDQEIAAWLKPYVTTAVINGTVRGMNDTSGGLVFAPDEPVTIAQAAVMVSSALGIDDLSLSQVYTNVSSGEPAWAYQATISLGAYNIMDIEAGYEYNTPLTRAMAAELIVNAVDAVGDGSTQALLDWAQ